jgi:hypothetical protein
LPHIVPFEAHGSLNPVGQGRCDGIYMFPHRDGVLLGRQPRAQSVDTEIAQAADRIL